MDVLPPQARDAEDRAIAVRMEGVPFPSTRILEASMGRKKLETRTNASGYREYRDPDTGEWRSTHRRAAEKKLGGLRDGFHVHHRDGNKTNNRRENLLEAHPKVHGRLHAHPDACVRCGRVGHWANTCNYKTFWDRTRLVE